MRIFTRNQTGNTTTVGVEPSDTVEVYRGGEINDAVAVAPAYFKGSQRQTTKGGGVIPGVNALRSDTIGA